MKTVWTKTSIQFLLQNSDKAVCKALLVVYANQTQSEQQAKDTTENNGVGFTGVDGEFLSSMAVSVKKYSALTPVQMKYTKTAILKY